MNRENNKSCDTIINKKDLLKQTKKFKSKESNLSSNIIQSLQEQTIHEESIRSGESGN